MKAITYQNYGPPDVLQVRDVPKPVPAEDELLIRVYAAEATKSDCELRSFRFSVNWFWLPLRIAIGIFRPRRRILGGYFAGKVESVGTAVNEFNPGDAVFGAAGLRLGAYGEYVALPASNTIAPKPENMTFEEAAAVPLGGLNALHFMRLANLKPGEEILINGAGGVIGAHAVQIAKSMGAVVTAVDKAQKEAFVRRIGADEFIDYQRRDFSKAGKEWDVIFDMVPRSSWTSCMRALKVDGRYFTGNPRLSVILRCILATKFSSRTAGFAFAAETKEELHTLKQMIENGRIQSILDSVCSMDNASEAHRRVETEERRGAVVINLNDS